MPTSRDVLRYAAGVSMIAYGVVAIIFGRNPSLAIPILYTVALLSFGVLLQQSDSWVGIALSLLSTWSQPFLARAVAPLLPSSAYASVIPSLIAFVVFLIGSLILGMSIRGTQLFHRASGVVLALAAVSVLFLGYFLYAIALAWIGYQVIPRPPRVSPTPPPPP
jgi:hypothetical protein